MMYTSTVVRPTARRFPSEGCIRHVHPLSGLDLQDEEICSPAIRSKSKTSTGMFSDQLMELLYIDCRLYGHDVIALVDPGSSKTLMSKKCAERCQVTTSGNIGWKCPLQIGCDLLLSTVSIVEDQPIDLSLGLDMLREHQCCLDFKRNMMVIGTSGESIPFRSKCFKSPTSLTRTISWTSSVGDPPDPLVLTLDVKKVNFGMNSMEVVLGLEDGGAIVSNYRDGLQYAVRIDSHGASVDTLYTTDISITAFIMSPANHLLILHHDGTIVRVQLTDGKLIDTCKIDVGYLVDGTLYDNENLLLVDCQRKEVFKYCMTTQSKEILVKSDKQSLCSIHKAESLEGLLYLVCTQHCVNIYNSDWCFQRFLGSENKGTEDAYLKYPNSAILTPWETVWVADSDNDAVKEFSLRGEFLRCIINRTEGINHPQKLSLCADQLWLSYRGERYVGSECNVNRYQLNTECGWNI